jgi:hypothetical protein
LDTLYDLWGSDTVHGDKIAYSKIAIGLLDSLNRILPETDLRQNLQSRKRSLDTSPDPTGIPPHSLPILVKTVRAETRPLAASGGAAAAAASTIVRWCGAVRCGQESHANFGKFVLLCRGSRQ